MSISKVGGAATSAKATGRAAGNDIVDSRAFELLARAGFVARGAVYAIIGVLAFRLAIGQGGKLTNQKGAFQTVAHQSFGHLLLVLVAVGLGGYSIWRLCRAALGHGPEGADSRLTASGRRQRNRLRDDVRRRRGDPDEFGRLLRKCSQEDRWRIRVARRHLVVGLAGVVMMASRLSGLPGHPPKFLKDSKTEEM